MNPGGTSLGRIPLACAALATIALYFGFILAWRADRPEVVTPPGSVIATAVQADLHALQARGFLKGQLSLDLAPPAELAAAANPYDPARRPPVLYLHDSSLYQGKYYMYFGPAPALLLFAPWKLVTGHDLPSAYAVGIFASAAYLGLLALFLGIVREYYPEASTRTRWAGVIALGGATMLFPLVRRPAVYEVAIACGCCAAIWGLYCAWRSRASERPVRWAAACGTLFGLAVAARPTLGLGAVAALLLMLPRGAGTPGTALRRVLAAAACGAVLVAALLAYNDARFGAPLEFGQKYQLSSQDEGAVEHFSGRFVQTQLWYYLLAPVRTMKYFPFFQETAEVATPAGFGDHEYSFGILTNVPTAWFLIPALLAIWLARPARPVLAALAVGVIVALIPLLFFFGSCVRYQAEFTPLLILLASLGALEAEAVSRHLPSRAKAIADLSILLAIASSALCAFASVDMYNPSANVAPAGLEAVGRWVNRPIIAVSGEPYGPLRLQLQPGNATGRRETLLDFAGPGDAREVMEIERLDDAQVRLIIRREGPEAFERMVTVPAPQGSQHELIVSMSSLYPQRAIELAEPMDRAAFRTLKIWLRIDWDGQRMLDEPLPIAPWRVQVAALGPKTVPVVFSGQVLKHERLPLPQPAPREPFGGVRLKVDWKPELRGHSLPLAVTGRHGRGNFLFVRVADDGALRFGYDHWGKPIILSPSVTLTSGGAGVIEFWMPSMRASAEASDLVVTLDGREVWRAAVPFYPASTEEIFVARNPLGGSSCERDFPGAAIESTQLHPR